MQVESRGAFAYNTPSAARVPAVKQEAKPAAAVKLERPPEPVSKWTLADYDQEEADARCLATHPQCTGPLLTSCCLPHACTIGVLHCGRSCMLGETALQLLQTGICRLASCFAWLLAAVLPALMYTLMHCCLVPNSPLHSQLLLPTGLAVHLAEQFMLRQKVRADRWTLHCRMTHFLTSVTGAIPQHSSSSSTAACLMQAEGRGF